MSIKNALILPYLFYKHYTLLVIAPDWEDQSWKGTWYKLVLSQQSLMMLAITD